MSRKSSIKNKRNNTESKNIELLLLTIDQF